MAGNVCTEHMNVRSLDRRSSDSAQARCDEASLHLARLRVEGALGLRKTWRVLSEIVAKALQVERIGIWLVADDGQAIRCAHLYQASVGQAFEGAVLRAKDFPEYFAAMDHRRTIIANDARTLPVTASLRDPYLEPLGITSMLDAPIYRSGQPVGVVCHEHVGPPRQWNEVESAFAATVADTVARLYEEDARQNAESSLHAYEAHVLELHRMEAVGRMAAGIAHDFRGVLGAITGFAQLAMRVQNVPVDARRHLQHIIDAAERGQSLTREITSFVQDQPISPRVLDVSSVVADMQTMLRSVMGDGIKLTFQSQQGIGRVFMDTTQIERALLNLVLNARDAMPTGGAIAIDIRETPGGSDASMVGISVTDTGCGMDAATLIQARTPLFTTKGDKGTGLGLAIVEQIVTRAGGLLRIESEPGKGTCATLLLPRIAVAATHAA